MKMTPKLIVVLLALFALTAAVGCKNKSKQNAKEEFGTPDISNDDIKEDMRTPEHVVVFTLDWGGQAVPLACWDDKQRKIRKESDCLGLVPPGDADLALASGRSTTMGKEQTVVCDPSGEEVPGLSTGITEGGDPDFGVWPSKGLKKFKVHAKSPRTLKPIEATPEEVTKLTQTIQRVAEKAKGTPEVLQKLVVDVDGDGKKDTVYSVMVKSSSGDEDMMYGFAGLILYPGSNPAKGQILTGSQWELPVVVATMDLDGDDAVEMVVYSSYYEGEAMTIERFSGGKLETVGGWGCGA